ncbi:hypothetical protein ASPBRDRAFT_45100 [Aspergillus brasiliensis CBS 101740]|uniref:Uncharacterized protein n=1 Tax=Aspergillus brasiliensis (strain CBS 101740 / IMI 381727 / IBT 21946) TaxID=767769 RepID=A0A1L9UDS4_ASPBC|nr:hypothetical protein ASPBRDRAFT_45100 [Aspergillus brasiliensis CBS 101740]
MRVSEVLIWVELRHLRPGKSMIPQSDCARNGVTIAPRRLYMPKSSAGSELRSPSGRKH